MKKILILILTILVSTNSFSNNYLFRANSAENAFMQVCTKVGEDGSGNVKIGEDGSGNVKIGEDGSGNVKVGEDGSGNVKIGEDGSGNNKQFCQIVPVNY